MTSYKDFKRNIMMKILDMEIEADEEFWPEAIFMQNKNGKESITYIEDLRNISDKKNIQIEEIIAKTIKKKNPKYLAIVFETRILWGDGKQDSVLSLLVGDIMDLECYEAQYYESDGVLKLENFEKLLKDEYPDEAVAVRRAMTYQNE